jgi:hypothetical protein
VRTSLLCLLAFLPAAPAPRAQDWPGHRLRLGQGTLIALADEHTGLTLWATRPADPGRRPPPDFVGWFDPALVRTWLVDGRALLGAASPMGDSVLETPPLVALDGATLTLIRRASDPADGSPFLVAFGHPAERARWAITAQRAELAALLGTLDRLGPRSRLSPPPDLGYANPTNRRATPDREPAGARFGPLPGPGEVWMEAELDEQGRFRPGSQRVLWATSPTLAAAVSRDLEVYRYKRHDRGRPARLRIYQRVRVGEKQ